MIDAQNRPTAAETGLQWRKKHVFRHSYLLLAYRDVMGTPFLGVTAFPIPIGNEP